MHEFAWFNHHIKSISEISLPAVSSAGFYGKSIFTTVGVYNSKPFQWKKHWRRLRENGIRLEIDLTEFSEKEVKTSISALVAENGVQDGRMRLTFFDCTTNGIWFRKTRNKTNLLVTTADFRAAFDSLRLTVAPFPLNSRSPLAGLKSGNYLENILVLEEAKRRGFDEAARLNEKGEIVSAAMANIFWVKEKKIFTPAVKTGALPGTTREFVIENLTVIEKNAPLAELESADEIFLTSAGIGIAKVQKFEKTMFGNSDISGNVQKIFENYTQNL